MWTWSPWAAARALGGCFRGCSTFCRDNFKTTLAGSRRGVRRPEKRRYSGRGFGRSVVVRLAVVTQVALMADPQNIWVALYSSTLFAIAVLRRTFFPQLLIMKGIGGQTERARKQRPPHAVRQQHNRGPPARQRGRAVGASVLDPGARCVRVVSACLSVVNKKVKRRSSYLRRSPRCCRTLPGPSGTASARMR